jgi:endonuclease YncB( thermonuclease family)
MDSLPGLGFRLALLVALSGACLPTHAAQPFRGPVEAKVVMVLDGDTFVAEATVWPGHTVRVNVRIRGIDAPEMKARCPAERRAAEKARQTLAALLHAGVAVVSNIAGAKYYGRVLADVATPDGQAVAPFLLGEGLVRPYEGGRRAPWCG